MTTPAVFQFENTDHPPSAASSFTNTSFINSEDDLSDCRLCPRNCHVNRLMGERGFCGEAGVIRAARAALYYTEEPVISGTRGSGTVFFSGCNLGCIYCQNRLISRPGRSQAICPSSAGTVDKSPRFLFLSNHIW